MNRLSGNPAMLRTPHEVQARFNAELAACPFCGGVPMLHVGPSPHVTCTGCAADGPCFEARKGDAEEMQYKAILAWNARTNR